MSAKKSRKNILWMPVNFNKNKFIVIIFELNDYSKNILKLIVQHKRNNVYLLKIKKWNYNILTYFLGWFSMFFTRGNLI